MSLIPSPFSRLASDTVSGLVSTAAQTIAGAKTFASAIVASAGIQLAALWNTNGAGATDVCVKVGTSAADATVDAGAKLLSVRTGIGTGAEVEKLSVDKSGNLTLDGGVSANGATVLGDTNVSAVGPLIVQAKATTSIGVAVTLDATANAGGHKFSFISTGPGAAPGTGAWAVFDGTSSAYRLLIGPTGKMAFNLNAITAGVSFDAWGVVTDTVATIRAQSFNATQVPLVARGCSVQTGDLLQGRLYTGDVQVWGVSAAGVQKFSGTDSSATPGAATINKPSGRSAFPAAPATSVTITNSLVTAATRVQIQWEDNIGTGNQSWVVPAAGSFTVWVSSAVGGNKFNWQISEII